jgi:hypothetical protein
VSSETVKPAKSVRQKCVPMSYLLCGCESLAH